ncbi:pyridoxamine 5'-phosphate oxidase family protein [Flavobacterium laiguense]|uniref:Pyridoxamine 5'-phosphate oxidase n=1 Tax=Flavobacterium laiguense TaxID=2169409 RepID=A0A2U1JNH0_9FLAO|nr:pyridoxamine 5'-phosphate oxidase family protein [Flavobacterium laiguense]PWA06721.1 pyridoxamine 5'-phosphate oxidase [Flavobacterium laiguense]
MAKNFAEIAFTDAVKELQEKHGSRKGYERMEKFNIIDGLSENEKRFIEDRDSFYLASIGVKNFPYIQHRGGPKGFVKVIDKDTIGFIDFTGNKQYISVGNVATNNNVALIMMDYPARARLKIFARAEIVELKDSPELLDSFDLGEYQYRPERIMLFHIEAYDWNCPQHITPRFTVGEIEKALKPQLEKITQLEKENQLLRQKIKDAGL